MVVNKFCGIKDAHDVIHNQQDCPDPANLELALMQQYKSLFVYSESKFAQESNQLVSFNAISFLNISSLIPIAFHYHFDF